MKIAALFDLDGVVFDTEGQYTMFWEGICREFLGDAALAAGMKGRTLVEIYGSMFPGMPEMQKEITARLDAFEMNMDYLYVPGAKEFIGELASRGIPHAVVTSSNRKKMENVYAKHPDFKGLFDRIFTGEDVSRSKPAPDCFLLGMEHFGVKPSDTLVFEDSFNGLKAARASGGKVIGLATTNQRTDILPLADIVIDDFRGVTVDSLLHGA